MMAGEIIWIYPNTAELNREGNRGGLSERQRLSSSMGFDVIEMPGDFVKNGSECAKLGSELGWPLISREQVSALYSASDGDQRHRYSLHTEPAVPRNARGYRPTCVDLRWYDPEWLDQFWMHVTGIVDYLRVTPEIVEVHPGYRPNSPRGVAQALVILAERWRDRYGSTPQFLLENRTGQVVADADGFGAFWSEVVRTSSDITHNLGIVVDFQQLYTETRAAYRTNLSLLPITAVKSCHVHAKHGVPSSSDPIDWVASLDLVRERLAEESVFVLPEVHHRVSVQPTVEFIRGLLNVVDTAVPRR